MKDQTKEKIVDLVDSMVLEPIMIITMAVCQGVSFAVKTALYGRKPQP